MPKYSSSVLEPVNLWRNYLYVFVDLLFANAHAKTEPTNNRLVLVLASTQYQKDAFALLRQALDHQEIIGGR